MSKALYRKYRSKSLDEVVGQKHITDILKVSLKKGIVAHAYLLTGPRGVGKTSVARILAHEINGLDYTDESNHLDIIEIDAASNNGVEDVRDLRDKVQIAPSSAKKKVYIIDEVHMLSRSAFNALLKTLEEPPAHVVFILATTDADRLPATIVSRTQRFSFRPIKDADIVSHLEMIAKKEEIDIEKSALELIARRGQGSFRDSISLLDQVSSLSGSAKITSEQIASTLGVAPAEVVAGMLAASGSGDVKTTIKLLDECEDMGVDPLALSNELANQIKHRLSESPQLATLLIDIVEVPKSPNPYLKLLAILVRHQGQKQTHKSAALAASSPIISAPIEELEKAATTKRPALPAKPTKAQEASPEPIPQPTVNPDAPAELDWDSLVEYTRQKFVAIYSVLSKCSYELNGSHLIIYAGNAFYKKKLDDTRYRINLTEALANVCKTELTIEVLPSKAPPKDEQAAKVAAIMGGGEEVSVEI